MTDGMACCSRLAVPAVESSREHTVEIESLYERVLAERRGG
jgi:hypothetical protein